MSTEQNKAVVRRYYEGDRDGRDNVLVWDQICDPDIALFASILPQPMRGLEPLKQFTTAAHSAFSNFGIMVEDLIAEGDTVAARWTMRGTHIAPFPLPGGNLPPTGKQIAVSGMSICRLAAGKLVEERVEADWLGMMQQLGVIPAPGQGG
jgi:predicted ester cyclase